MGDNQYDYEGRHPCENDNPLLDEWYGVHVDAMTREGLHSKNAIAVELAWRDAEITRLSAQLAKATELASDVGEAIGIEIVEGNELQSAIDGLFEMRSQIDEWRELAEAEGQEPVGHVERDIGCGTYELHAYREVDEFAKLYTHPSPAKVPEGNALVPDGLLDLLNAVGHVGADFGYGPYRLSADQIRQAQEFYDMLKSQGGE